MSQNLLHQKAKILQLKDKEYSSLLKQIHKPPQQLFYKGNLEILEKPCMAVVGTRKNSDYGEYLVKKIIKELAAFDICIVSGLARGIDTLAHHSALENNLSTIAVLGSGIDYIYPRENYQLAVNILKTDNLIISEFPDLTEPVKTNFPRRNRIISGLSLGILVIEAPEKSGALITSTCAADQNREVFTIPGDIDRPNSTGTLKLLQNGAHPISSGREIIEILQAQPSMFPISNKDPAQQDLFQQAPPNKEPSQQEAQEPPKNLPKITYNLTELQQKILEAIPKNRPQTFEKILQKSSLPITQLLIELSFLEINKAIINQNNSFKRLI